MTLTQLKTALAAAAIVAAAAPTLADTPSAEIDLTYVWTAHEGQAERLIATYAAVGEMLEANEPGLLSYEIAISETGDQIIIHEVFENGEALAFHLSETAAVFFPQLVEFATPGPFIFRGEVPEELRAAAYGMNMGAVFTGDWDGFARDLARQITEKYKDSGRQAILLPLAFGPRLLKSRFGSGSRGGGRSGEVVQAPQLPAVTPRICPGPKARIRGSVLAPPQSAHHHHIDGGDAADERAHRDRT